MVKLALVIILVAAAIAFGVCLDLANTAGAILEWAIAFGFTFYLLTFWYDLRQAKGVPRGATKHAQPINHNIV